MINQDRLIKTFLQLVKIDSPSGSEANVAREITKRLKALGLKVSQDQFGNVIGKWPGNSSNDEPIMLNAHLDTVEPGRGIKPQVDGGIIRSDGSTILGADPKAGVAAILEALTAVKEHQKSHLPIEVVFTLGEEAGLQGAINLDYNQITAKRGVTFDNGEGVTNIMIAAPGYNRVDLTIIGRAAHAGAEPEKGISAIKIAAQIITKLKLGRIDHETTTNVGLIEGGSARNAVPETVTLKGEIRSHNLKKLERLSIRLQRMIDQVILKHPKARFELDLHREFDPYHFEESHQMIQTITRILIKMGLKPELKPSGGGTDVNIFHTHGIEAVAVGAGSHEEHTTREYLKIPEMLQAARFCEQLVTS